MENLVSIVIPVFNGGKFIDKCIASALNQSYSNIEAIIVDDGSTDCTALRAKELVDKDSRVRYLKIDNSGVTAARKAGIDCASGSWICFLDVDDTLPQNAIETYSVLFEEQADIIASGEPSLSLEEYKARLMMRKSHPELWCKLFKATFIKKHYPSLDRSIIIGEDQIINLVLANNAKKLVTINNLQYRYNLSNPGSVTKRFHRTASYEIEFEQLFNTIVLPGLDPLTDALQYSVFKMKIEGFKMVVLDGNRFNPNCNEWREIIDYYKKYSEQLAPSERLLINLSHCQFLYAMLIKGIIAARQRR